MGPRFIYWNTATVMFLVATLNVYAAVQQGPPPGWSFTGDRVKDYETGLDSAVSRAAKPSAFLKSKVEQFTGYGTLIQTISAEHYLGKRVKLSAWLKTEDVKDASGLWMKVDGPHDKLLCFDNMENRPVKGSSDWRQYSVVLDVPQEATSIKLGFLLFGPGQVWANDFEFRAVAKDTPSTNMWKPEVLINEPVNLDFRQSKEGTTTIHVIDTREK